MDDSKPSESKCFEDGAAAMSHKRALGGDAAARKKQRADPYLVAYQSFRFEPVAASGRPGTPHSYFSSSYQVYHDKESSEPSSVMRIHKHANGLNILTLGDSIPDGMSIQSVDMHVQSAPASSAAAKRKQQAAMLRGKQRVQDSVGVVKPCDDLCTITYKHADGNQTTITLPCGVFGTVMEINPNLSTDLVQKDPLLSGYLAVILPSGPFPPVGNGVPVPLGGDNKSESVQRRSSPSNDPEDS